MRKWILAILALPCACLMAWGQAQPNRFPPINLVAGDPTGTACPAHSMVQSSDSGILYTCQGGAYHTAGGQTIPVTAVTWPPSCTTGTYVPATNTCVPTGTAANPGGSPGQTQINAGGSTFIGIPGSLTDTTYGWKTQGGINYAKGYQTGGGNNGIANAQASAQTVVSDPSYSMTEVPALSVFSSTPMHWKDQRVSQEMDFFRNPGTDSSGNPVYAGRFGTYGEWGKQITCQYDTTFGTAGYNVRPGCLKVDMVQMNPGSNLANNIVGPQGWQTGVPISSINKSYSAGLLETFTFTQTKNGVGDNTGEYCYILGQGGWTDPSGEQAKCYAANVIEQPNAYAGKATSTTANPLPATNPTAITTTPLASPYIDLQGVGRYLIYRGQCSNYPTTCATVPPSGLITANITSGLVTGGLGIVSQVTIDGTVTPSGAWWKLNGNCNTANPNGNPPFTTSVTCPLTLLGGSTFNTTDLVCFQGEYHDCAVPTATSATSITIPLRRQHASGTLLFQGGMAGYGLELSATTAVAPPFNGVVSTQPLRYMYDVFGSIDSHNLIVGWFKVGSSTNLPANITFFNIAANLSSQDTLVTGTYVVAGSTLNALNLTGNPIWIDGSSDATLNGICTNFAINFGAGATTFTCTHAGLTGAHTSTTTTTGRLTGNNLPMNAYSLWPMAEVTDVRNNSVNPPVVDGTLALEQNVFGTVSVNDYLEETHHLAARWGGSTTGVTDDDINSLFSVATFTGAGAGVSGGASGITSNSFLAVTNSNADTIYQNGGGSLTPPNMLNMAGAYNIALNFDHAPANGGGMMVVNPKAYQSGDPTLQYGVFTLFNRTGGASGILASPYFGDMTVYPGRILNFANSAGGGTLVNINSDFGSQTFRGHATFAALAAPVLTVTPRTTGGTLADGTYYYQVQSRGSNPTLFSAKSNEATCVIATGGANTGSCFLSWTPVAGASSYYPMGRATSGGELNFPFTTGISSTIWIDNNSATPSGSNAATGNAGIEQAGWLGLNSSGTANELKLQAPAGMAASVTITVTKISGVSITPAAVTASTCAEQTFNTYTGLATGQVVTVSPPAALGAHIWMGSTRVSAANTLAIAFCADATGGTPPAGAYLAVAF